jgi:6-phosphogluconolactonase
MAEQRLPATISLQRFDSREACALALANHIADKLDEDIRFTGEASLLLSGGSTPVPMFQALSQKTLDWSRVKLSLADDRWLAPDHKDSNQGKIEQHLLVNQASNAQWLPLWNGAETDDIALEITHARLALMPEKISVLVLGIGNDGHTASLFPCSEQLASVWDTPSDCAFVEPTTAPYKRITLTPQRLLASKERILHICGEDKLNTLVKALATNDRDQMPICHFLNQPLRIFWAA